MSKKIGLLTFQSAVNYGAALQMYALYRSIEKNNDNVEVIDYIGSKQETDYRLFYPHNFRGNILRKIKVLLRDVLQTRYLWMKRRNFKKFLLKNIRISDPYDNLLEIPSGQYDSIIVGSDQVWNPKITGNDFAYFLDFCKGSKRYSYAASFGSYNLLEDKKIERYKKQLECFDKISVREQVSKDMLAEMGIKDTIVSIDPTLLLDASEWQKMEKVPKVNEKYILVYTVRSLSETGPLYKLVKELKKRTGLRVLDLSALPMPKSFAKAIATSSPDEFVGYIHGASYVITDSFHGTIFSALMHKQFLVDAIRGGHNNKKYDSRISNLLKILNLSDRMIDPRDNKRDVLGYMNSKIDWRTTELELKSLRSESEKYLADICEGLK